MIKLIFILFKYYQIHHSYVNINLIIIQELYLYLFIINPILIYFKSF